jgi:hypothetical protein
MIKKKETEFSTGQMEENTRVSGSTESSTEKEYTLQQVEKLNVENGTKEKEHGGSNELNNFNINF